MKLVIENFPEGPGVWRIDFWGKVSSNPHIEDEPCIAVHLTEVTSKTEPLSTRSLLRNSQFTAQVPIGLLPRLTIGSLWHEKSPISHLVPSEVLRVEPAKVAFVRLDGRREGLPLIPARYYPLGQHFPDLKDAPLIMVPGGPSGVAYTLIPCAEVYRVYYMSSTATARASWYNSLQDLLDPEQSKVLEDNDVFLRLPKTTLDNEGWLLARWMTSPKMRAELGALNRRAATASVNSRGAPALHAEIGFPFEAPAKLAIAGKLICIHEKSEANPARWAFLVLRICNCDSRFPFRNLIIDRENKNGQDPNADRDQLPAQAWGGPINAPDEPNEALSVSGIEYSQKGTATTVVEQSSDIFTDLRNHQLVKEPNRAQQYRSAKAILRVIDIEGYSTGPGATHSDRGPLSIDEKPEKDAPIVELKAFLEVLDDLRRGDSDGLFDIRTIAVGLGAFVEQGEHYYRYPKKMPRMRSWHLIDNSRPRRAIVAEVRCAGRSLYLFEMERRLGKPGLSTLALWHIHQHPLNREQIDWFLKETARNNGWATPPSDLRAETIDHSAVQDQYKERLRTFLQRRGLAKWKEFA